MLLLLLLPVYGKIIHTWQIDRDALPIGPPQLMTSVTAACKNVMHAAEFALKDEITGVSSVERAAARKESIEYKPRADGADQWEASGKGIAFKPDEVPLKEAALDL